MEACKIGLHIYDPGIFRACALLNSCGFNLNSYCDILSQQERRGRSRELIETTDAHAYKA